MKVTVGDGDLVYEVVEKSDNYYILRPLNSNQIAAYQIHKCKPVPDERWEDVTERVSWDEKQNRLTIELSYDSQVFHPTSLTVIARKHYRFVKRSLWDLLAPAERVAISNHNRVQQMKEHMVLQVERKVSE